jgi:hypothetical protein
MGAPYRDSQEMMRERARMLEDEVKTKEARYSVFFWQEVAPRVNLPQPAPFPTLNEELAPEALNQAVADREARLASLEQIERALPELELEWGRPSPDVPDCAASTIFDIQGSLTRMLLSDPYIAVIDRALRRLESEVPFTVKEEGKGARSAAIMSDGVPLKIRCETFMTQRSGDWKIDVTVQTTVPRVFGVVRLSPQGFGSELLIGLGLKRDIKLGEREFDGYFVIQGHEPTVRAVLDEEVRRHLLDIAKDDIPSLILDKGLATLRWHFEPSDRCLRAAIAALKQIRRAPPERSFFAKEDSPGH